MSLRESIASSRTQGPTVQADGTSFCTFQFPSGDPVFAGHFPGRPLLPGVCQLEMTRSAAEWMLHESLTIREIEKAKFLRPILPEDEVRLDLKLVMDQASIRAVGRLSVRGEPAGEATLQLERQA